MGISVLAPPMPKDISLVCLNQEVWHCLPLNCLPLNGMSLKQIQHPDFLGNDCLYPLHQNINSHGPENIFPDEGGMIFIDFDQKTLLSVQESYNLSQFPLSAIYLDLKMRDHEKHDSYYHALFEKAWNAGMVGDITWEMPGRQKKRVIESSLKLSAKEALKEITKSCSENSILNHFRKKLVNIEFRPPGWDMECLKNNPQSWEMMMQKLVKSGLDLSIYSSHWKDFFEQNFKEESASLMESMRMAQSGNLSQKIPKASHTTQSGKFRI